MADLSDAGAGIEGDEETPGEARNSSGNQLEDGEDSGGEDEDDADGDDAEDCAEDGEHDCGGDESNKSKKRRLDEERRRKWKEYKKDKRKQQGSSRRKKRRLAPQDGGEADAGDKPAEAAVSEQVVVSKEEARAQRSAKKAAELDDFKARCEKGTTVVLDLEWEDSMNQKEIKSLVQQVMYCYGSNRSASHPVRLVLSGLTKDSETSSKLRKMAGFEAWPIEVLDGPYVDRFPREKLVYLTADTETVLQEFDREKVYVIGGIVDHNRLKGVTRAKADEQGIGTMQLPLGEHIEMGSFSRVLAVNHVLSIVLELQAGGKWRQVLEKCIPGRKKFIDQITPNQSEDKGAASTDAGAGSDTACNGIAEDKEVASLDAGADSGTAGKEAADAGAGVSTVCNEASNEVCNEAAEDKDIKA